MGHYKHFTLKEREKLLLFYLKRTAPPCGGAVGERCRSLG